MKLISSWKRRYWRADHEAIATLPGATPATVITGGSDGIGLALAKVFAAPGTVTVLVARNAPKLTAAKAAVEQAKPGAGAVLTLSLDVTAETAPAQISEFLSQHDLYVDILINSAGVGTTGDFSKTQPERLTAEVDLNVTALTRLCRAFLPAMLIRGRGGIINLSSLGGFAPGPYQATYYASKAYVTSFTRALAHETRGQGVRIAAVAPGPVNTEFHAHANGETSLYRRILPALSPDAVAAGTYRGYHLGQSLIIPGLFNNLTGLVMRVVPAEIVTPVVAILLKPRPPMK